MSLEGIFLAPLRQFSSGDNPDVRILANNLSTDLTSSLDPT